MTHSTIYENLARKLFQCTRYNDPLSKLANAENYYEFINGQLHEEFRCMAWAIGNRLLVSYLDSKTGRQQMYQDCENAIDQILNAQLNDDIHNSMNVFERIVNDLGIQENPYLNYSPTNDG